MRNPIAPKPIIFTTTLLLTLANLAPVTVQASDYPLYYGLQIANLNYESDSTPDREPHALVARFGYRGDTVGYEFRSGFGDTDHETKVDFLLGAYMTGQMRSGSISMYGLLGLSNSLVTVNNSASSGGFSENNESGVSFGFGASYGENEKMQFTIEYISYLDEDDFGLNAISLGVTSF